MAFDTTAHDAIVRLFELAQRGDTRSCEFEQLDSLILDGLSRTYPPSAPAIAPRRIEAIA